MLKPCQTKGNGVSPAPQPKQRAPLEEFMASRTATGARDAVNKILGGTEGTGRQERIMGLLCSWDWRQMRAGIYAARMHPSPEATVKLGEIALNGKSEEARIACERRNEQLIGIEALLIERLPDGTALRPSEVVYIPIDMLIRIRMAEKPKQQAMEERAKLEADDKIMGTVMRANAITALGDIASPTAARELIKLVRRTSDGEMWIRASNALRVACKKNPSEIVPLVKEEINRWEQVRIEQERGNRLHANGREIHAEEVAGMLRSMCGC
ncbi:MAG: hypothetical protein WC350_04400 [Candidatus Micrarchaeia archaeon]